MKNGFNITLISFSRYDNNETYFMFFNVFTYKKILFNRCLFRFNNEKDIYRIDFLFYEFKLKK
jgi:hypothetical protein